jgi:hypothetical protein
MMSVMCLASFGSTIWSCSRDSHIRIWDPEVGRERGGEKEREMEGTEGRWRGDGGEMEGRWRGDGGDGGGMEEMGEGWEVLTYNTETTPHVNTRRLSY